MKPDLSLRQTKFCQEYAKSGNATKSAILAGYSKNGAEVHGCRLLRIPKITEHIQKLTERPEEARITTAIERQEWLSKLIFGEIKDYYMLPDGTVIERQAKIADRIRAAELLAKMRGELIHNHALAGDVTVTKTVVKRFDGSGG